MRRIWEGLALAGSIITVPLMVMIALYMVLGYVSLVMLLVLAAMYAWVLFVFLHYRQCRQEEFLQVISAAAEAEAPLAPALRAYLRDRPRGGLREFWVALLLFYTLPGYYWLVYRRSNYDRKIGQVAQRLEQGSSLKEALRMTPGVAPRAMLLAVALGEETGQLARCLQSLHNPARNRLATLWVEMVPRFAYPLLLLLVISAVLQFWTLYLAPKFQRIFMDFHRSLPEETERAMALGNFAMHYSWALVLAMPVLVVILVLLLVSPTFRWHFPVVGHLYRAYVRSQILHALSFLLQMKEPAPQALAVLAENEYFVEGAQNLLEVIGHRIEQGETLADSLRWGKILPRAMVPLLRVAERTGNLPRVLAELADLLAQRTTRRVQRLGMVLSPVPVLAVGVLVGVIAIGLFMPLISLIEGFAQ